MSSVNYEGEVGSYISIVMIFKGAENFSIIWKGKVKKKPKQEKRKEKQWNRESTKDISEAFASLKLWRDCIHFIFSFYQTHLKVKGWPLKWWNSKNPSKNSLSSFQL
jgi:hypothetical protein